LASQEAKSVYCIRGYQRQFGYFDYLECFKAFDSMVKPILLYRSEIWGFKYSDIIERVQVKYCKHFLGINKTTNNDVALDECGSFP
jgi:hypothetical protein